MSRIGIIGGALQGTEIAYLAKEAGLRTMMIDRRADAPALDLADEVVIMDIVKDRAAARELLERCDAIIPANENKRTLEAIVDICASMSTVLLFDPDAYRTTSSKIATNRMMRANSAPMPEEWPGCGFPVIVKPSGCSGSHGVSRVDRIEDIPKGVEFARRYDDELVIQEFVSGPSISLEVIGKGNEAVSLQTTEVVLDEHYDCKMVLAPCENRHYDEEGFKRVGVELGTALELKGIMDVEAIVDDGVPKILELDARFPSQTPSAVLHSTGWNMLGIMYDWYVNDKSPKLSPGNIRQAIYEHVRVREGRLESLGEDMMAECSHLRMMTGLYGADVTLTDMREGDSEWKATLITTGRDKAEAWKRRQNVLDRIMDEHGITQWYDSEPGGGSR